MRPYSFDLPEDISWNEAMKYDIREMLRCDGVVLLANWDDSKGACIEARLAADLGMATRPVSRWVNPPLKNPQKIIST